MSNEVYTIYALYSLTTLEAGFLRFGLSLCVLEHRPLFAIAIRFELSEKGEKQARA